MIGLYIVGVGWIFCGWWLFCAKKAFNQREWMRKNSRPLIHADWLLWGQLFDERMDVSFNQHSWYLLTFRNPIKLYGPKTQAQWAEGHA